jgi:predicted RNase H-like HicB family nuclease
MNKTLETRIKKLHKNFKLKNKIWHKVVKVFNPKSIEMYEIIIELQKKLDEKSNVDEAFMGFMELVNKNCKLEKENKLAVEALIHYTKLDNPELAKETLSKFMKKYYAVIDNNFGVVFPDFDGCVSVGKDLKDAINMAQEALEFHVEGMREDGEELPEPKTLKEVRQEYYENVLIYQSIFIK